jgi:proteasome lid subunit RPN8/RPN11
MNLRLAAGLLDDIVQNARTCYPNEGCGLLAGRQDVAYRLVPMTNVRSSATEFEMDPRELIQQLRLFRESGEQVLAIYHTHPQDIAWPSERDIARAAYPESATVIVSLKDPESPQVRAFRIVSGEVIEIELHAIV